MAAAEKTYLFCGKGAVIRPSDGVGNDVSGPGIEAPVQFHKVRSHNISFLRPFPDQQGSGRQRSAGEDQGSASCSRKKCGMGADKIGAEKAPQEKGGPCEKGKDERLSQGNMVGLKGAVRVEHDQVRILHQYVSFFGRKLYFTDIFLSDLFTFAACGQKAFFFYFMPQ